MEIVAQLLRLDFLGSDLWLWLVFALLVSTLLVFDLGVLNRQNRELGLRESLYLSAGYVTMGLGFGAWVWWELGAKSGLDYFTGFLVEKSLSIDNVFVIAMIFSYLAIPRAYQHRVLFWGILGAIVLRGVMIGFGSALLSEFTWMLFVFGALLIYTGAKMVFVAQGEFDLAANPIYRVMRRYLRIAPSLHEGRFWVRLPAPAYRGGPPLTQPGQPLFWWATPAFLALVLVECADVIFAIDSVPAILAITQDTYIVYTSNIFALLGLRAMYFLLAATIPRFRYLKTALALVLVFIGSKIMFGHLFGPMPAWSSLAVTVGLLVGGVAFSLWKTAPRKARAT